MAQDNIDEDPFDLIQKGNAFHSSSSHWSAAYAYSRASLALRHRADAISASPAFTRAKKNEQEKIISLYRAQSLEYFYKARHSLLTALTFENEQDRRNTCEVAEVGVGALDPTCCFIGKEEGERRRRIFDQLFVMQEGGNDCIDRTVGQGTKKETQEQLNVVGGSDDNNDDIDIPHAPSKSLVANTSSTETAASVHDVSMNDDSQQRLNDIRSGLKRLGVSLPDEYQGNKPYVVGNEQLSNEDQVNLIIQQATDEVRVETSSVGHNEKHDIDDLEINESDSMFDGYQEHLDDNDNDLDSLLIKVEKMVASISKRDGAEMEEKDHEQHYDILHDHRLQMIRNAQALLLEARLCLELEREEEDNHSLDVNHDNFTEGEKDSSTDTVTVNETKDDSLGCQRRRKARGRIDCAVRCLQDGLSKWASYE